MRFLHATQSRARRVRGTTTLAQIVISTCLLASCLVVVACKGKSGEIEYTVEATVEVVDSGEIVHVVVETEPGMILTVLPDDIVADESGHAEWDEPVPDTWAEAEAIVIFGFQDPEDNERRIFEVEVTAPRTPFLKVIDSARDFGSALDCNYGLCGFAIERDLDIRMYGTEGLSELHVGDTTQTESPWALPLAEIVYQTDLALLLGDGEYDVGLPVAMVYDDGRRYEGMFPVDRAKVLTAMAQFFPTVTEGPVAVPVENDGNAILWIGDNGMHAERAEVIGEATTLGDIGRIALVTLSVDHTVDCGTYVAPDGATRSAAVRVQRANLDLYDRRSGELLESHGFLPDGAGCPDSVWEGESTRAEYPGVELMRAWLEARP